MPLPLSSPLGAARLPRLHPVLPGLALCAAIALAAIGLQRALGITALSPLILAMGLGMALRNLVPLPLHHLAPGAGFCIRRLLRLAVILLGAQLTFAQVASLGWQGIVTVTACLALTFLFTLWMGRRLGIDPQLTQLIAAGTSVCGASAVIATNTVTRGSDEDVAYAIACVTVFGSLSMISYPLVLHLTQMAPQAYGLWSGATIHEVAQVMGTAFQGGDAAGQTGAIAKLGRVILLAPLILTLGAATGRGKPSTARAPIPWFVFGFLALVLVNTLWPIPAALAQPVKTATTALMTLALAAMGLETDVRRLRAKGLKPLALGAAAWVFISGLGLLLTLTL